MRLGIAAVVEAAAKLGIRWVGGGGVLDVGLAEGAYCATPGRESVEDGATYPASAAVATVELLVAAGPLEGDLLNLRRPKRWSRRPWHRQILSARRSDRR